MNKIQEMLRQSKDKAVTLVMKTSQLEIYKNEKDNHIAELSR